MSKKKAADDTPPVPTFDVNHHVKLSAGDGHVFIVDRNTVKHSPVITACLASLQPPPSADAPPPDAAEVARRDGALATAELAGITVEAPNTHEAPGASLPHVSIGCMTGAQLEALLRFTHHKNKATWESTDVRTKFALAPGEGLPKGADMHLLASAALLGL
uniref:Uncharacterized protein n=1 Tax=Neobodo designis TaxID=312471 RepID=A0A7S1Q695_NEODS|mmetsp:Transcript_32452/g.100400  ORF Transcript_32452/g.100400 Transcript_32452/m.100400 type:complete len:161 (+) Transcript_32452:44-526(+)